MQSGPLLEWIAYSGLTQEEAALIQPAYEPPSFDALLPDLLAGSTIANEGVRYESFEFDSTNFFVGDVPIFFSPGGQGSGFIDPAGLGAAALRGVYVGEFDVELDPLYDDWLFFGARDNVGQMGSTTAAEMLAVRFSFDVVSERPGQRISAAELSSSSFYNFNYVGFGGGGMGHMAIATTVRRNGAEVADLALDSDGVPFFLNGSSAAEFLGAEKVNVETTAILSGDAQLTSLNFAFRIVPEPSALILAALAAGLLAAARSRPSWSQRSSPAARDIARHACF